MLPFPTTEFNTFKTTKRSTCWELPTTKPFSKTPLSSARIYQVLPTILHAFALMQIKMFKFEVEHLTVHVPYEEATLGQAIIPSFRPVPTAEPEDAVSDQSLWAQYAGQMSPAHGLSTVELQEDLASLMPRSLANFPDGLFERLCATLEGHVAQHGRLFEGDLNLYVDETILLLRSLDVALGMQPLSDDEAREAFVQIISPFLESPFVVR